MKLGVMGALFGGMSLDDALDYCQKVGLDAIELPAGAYPGDPWKLVGIHKNAARLKELKAKIADRGLEVLDSLLSRPPLDVCNVLFAEVECCDAAAQSRHGDGNTSVPTADVEDSNVRDVLPAGDLITLYRRVDELEFLYIYGPGVFGAANETVERWYRQVDSPRFGIGTLRFRCLLMNNYIMPPRRINSQQQEHQVDLRRLYVL